MAADEKLVAELDGMLWRIEGNYHREGAGPGSRFEGQTLQAVQARALLRRIVEWLSERGRLVPDGASGEQQCGLLHSDGDATSVTQCEVAREIASVGAGQHAHRTVITTPWVAVQPKPEEMPDA